MLNLSKQKIDTSEKLSVQENIKYYEKKDKLFHAKQLNALKQVQEEMEQMKESDPSIFEVIYQQKLLSASRFENVDYNISDILDFVGGQGDSRGAAESQLTQYHTKNLEPFVQRVESDVIYCILSS